MAHNHPAEHERADRSDQALQCAAVREAAPPAFPRNVDTGPGVVIEQPDDVAAAIENEVCIVPGAFVTKEAPAVVGYHPEEFICSDDPVQSASGRWFCFL